MSTHIDTASELESLINSWRRRLVEISALAATAKPDPERWSISEVVGHLVDSACNNHQRFVRAQFCSDFVFPKYEQNEWVIAANYRECDWESLVELWYHYNRQLQGSFAICNLPVCRRHVRSHRMNHVHLDFS